MDTAKKSGELEIKTIQLVLEEQTREQENNTKAIGDLISAVNTLSGKMQSWDEKLDKPKSINVSTDTKPIQEIMKKGVADMKFIVSTKPVPVIKKFQMLLFPEQDAKLFYKIVFGRWFLFLVLMLLITDLYNFSVHWGDNQKEIQQEELENDKITKAWFYLYSHENRVGKRAMDSAYYKGNSK